MSDPSTYSPAGRLGFASAADVDLFVATLEKYERGELDADAWRAFRLLNGTYGQRQPNVQMLRVKIPQGILSAVQLRRLADVATAYGGRAHITTRQNVQFYQLPLPDVEAIMRSLVEVGLTTKEACGHSVRNITASPLAGVDPDEIFDVVPYAEALTRHLLRGPKSSSLPRKFKIAFEGSPRNEVRAAINDLAFVARVHEGRRGFAVLVGGGTATMSRAAESVVDFLPVKELFAAADAVITVFHRDGERGNKAKARIKWLIKKIGFPELKRRVLVELDALRAAGVAPLPFDPESPPVEAIPETRAGLPVPAREGYDAFLRTNVLAQKQPGRSAVTIRLRLGDLSPAACVRVAELAERFSDGSVRATVEQNVILRHVRTSSLTALHAALVDANLATPGAGSLADVTSCAGADTCAIAVTASRGMGALLTDALAGSAAELGEDPGLAGAQIKVSGCPNGCGQHHIAAISLQGGMRTVGGKPLPMYIVAVGGGPDRFARNIGRLAARRAPQALQAIIALWRAERSGDESLDAWLARAPLPPLKAALEPFGLIDEHTAQPEDFIDLGQTEAFEVVAGEAECAQ